MEISGLIESIEFDEGQAVKARDVLFRLRSAEQRARLREAESELALQKAIHERTVRLVKGNVSSAAQLDRAAAEHERAKARVQLARVQLDRTCHESLAAVPRHDLIELFAPPLHNCRGHRQVIYL